MVNVRRLGPEEHELLRTIRLRGLDAPDSFGSTYERDGLSEFEMERDLSIERNAG